MNEEKLLDLSWSTILKIVFTIFIAYLIFLIKEILILVLFSTVLAILFEPAIRFFQKFKVRRSLATLLVYLGFFLLLATIFFLLAKVLTEEAKQFFKIFPQIFDQSSPFVKTFGQEFFGSLQSLLNSLPQWISKASLGFFSAIVSLFGGIFSTLTIFALAIFISLEEGSIEKTISLFVPQKYKNLIETLWENSRQRVTAWFGARILTCCLVGIMVYLTCHFLEIEYGGLFALLAGFLDLLPIFGPFLAGLPIVLFALFDSFLKAIFAVLALLLIQQIEGNILTPFLSKRFLNVSPFLVLFSLLVGGKLFGFWGAIFAIPLLTLLFEMGKEILIMTKKETIYE